MANGAVSHVQVLSHSLLSHLSPDLLPLYSPFYCGPGINKMEISTVTKSVPTQHKHPHSSSTCTLVLYVTIWSEVEPVTKGILMI